MGIETLRKRLERETGERGWRKRSEKKSGERVWRETGERGRRKRLSYYRGKVKGR